MMILFTIIRIAQFQIVDFKSIEFESECICLHTTWDNSELCLWGVGERGSGGAREWGREGVGERGSGGEREWGSEGVGERGSGGARD